MKTEKEKKEKDMVRPALDTNNNTTLYVCAKYRKAETRGDF